MSTYPYGMNILVTGASSGIGHACAQVFADKGFHVWGASRSALSQDSRIHAVSMDVTDEESVSSAIERIWKEAVCETGKGIGTVVHCAGFGIAGAAEDTPHEDIENQFAANYFGVLRVNRILLPLMRSEGPSMVIVLGSIAGRISIPFQSHYSASKFALEAYVEALRIEGSLFGIRACIIEAGDTRTAFTSHRRMAIPEHSVYAKPAASAVAIMEEDERTGYSPYTVARQVFHMAIKRNPPVRKPVGVKYSLLMFAKRLLPDRVAEHYIRSLYLKR